MKNLKTTNNVRNKKVEWKSSILKRSVISVVRSSSFKELINRANQKIQDWLNNFRKCQSYFNKWVMCKTRQKSNLWGSKNKENRKRNLIKNG